MSNQLADLRVMLSYARADAGPLARELADGLEAANFEVLLDIDDIEAAADWQERLADIIRSVDTIVIVLTPGWIASDICKWEFEEALRQNKRVIPILHKQPAPDAPPPEEISRLNYIFFDGSQPFGSALKELAPALRLNLGWIRDHTHYSESARMWEDRDRDPAMLLRGAELKRALAWQTDREPNFPEISMSLNEFLSLSEENETFQAAARKRTGSWTIAVFMIVPLCLTITNGYALWLNFDRMSGLPQTDLLDYSEMLAWLVLMDNVAMASLISGGLCCIGAVWLRGNLSSTILGGTAVAIAAIGLASFFALGQVGDVIVSQARVLDQKAASNTFDAGDCVPTLRDVADRYRDPTGTFEAPQNIAACPENRKVGAAYNAWRHQVGPFEFLPVFGLFILPILVILVLRLAQRRNERLPRSG